jgi:hypothetical protein
MKTMKTKITVCGLLISLLALVTFFSCDNLISLGKRLDVEGPIVKIISPSQRQSVPAQFDIEGTAWDYSGVEILLIKAVRNNVDFPRQWRYAKDAWQVSNDGGKTWSPLAGAVWNINGDTVSWKVPVNMVINNQAPDEGEYTFNIQAWDKSEFTDDNSFKPVVLIIDRAPPMVTITNPLLYSKFAFDASLSENEEFLKFHNWGDEEEDPATGSPFWQAPEFLGKFITQTFDLKWQIEDIDVWSIELRFYPYNIEIDDKAETPLPAGYFFKYNENTPPVPKPADPNEFINLNGTVTVPDFNDKIGSGTTANGGKWELTEKKPLKTTVKVVAVCYDAAGNPNQEKTLGYFISWPKASLPWITFPEDLREPNSTLWGMNPDDIKEDLVYTVYPSRTIKATAFQAQGVKEVKYSLYELNTSGSQLNNPATTPWKAIEENKVIENSAGRDSYSTIFPWELKVPPFTGFYIFRAEAFNEHGKSSGVYEKIFKVNDITFPIFDEGPFPAATDPLFMSIKDNEITITGKVSDATKVSTLCMAWINPNSKDFAAMSQLSYFRDQNYKGWKTIVDSGTSPVSEGEFDPLNPNKLWKLDLPLGVRDNETNRFVYDFTITLDITDDLGIGPGALQNALKSQVFLFRAENPDKKCTIITYAPQGDTLAPDIGITNVVLKIGSDTPQTFVPNTFQVIPQFKNGDTITVNGTWWEDSAAFLDIREYFLKNFTIDINNTKLPPLAIANITGVNPGTGVGNQAGTWNATINVGPGGIPEDKLKDTLVISVEAKDIGGNVAETGSSWLIKSDNLRLMRISSEAEDGVYKAGDKIDIFLEFSKPVQLSTGGLKPELILSSNSGNTARAVYKDGQTNLNSRQIFEYTVAAGQSTGEDFLNVKGLWYNNAAFDTNTAFNTANYPFSWSRGSTSTGDYEEVRITMRSGNNGLTPQGSPAYYVRTLPTNAVKPANPADNPDYQYTLRAGKNIKIDTTAPTATGVASASIAGHYRSGDIYITVTFSKPVIIGTNTPKLTLNVTGGGDPTTSPDNVRVNDRTITFMYRIKTTGDTTSGSVVNVTGFSGDITDLAGNALSGSITGALGSGVNGIYIDTVPLTAAPVVRVLSGNNISNVVSNNVNGTAVTGTSGTAVVNLSNVYNTGLWLAVTRGDTGGAAHRMARLEYSINGGTSWLSTTSSNTPFTWPSTAGGEYTVIARQVTQSGLVSPVSRAINLNWDSAGNFITRVTSTSANGTYTNNTNRQETIPITVTFRKGVKFSAQPSITLNTTPTASNANIVNAAGYTLNSVVTELTFNYVIGTDHNTPSGQRLNVTAFNLNGGVAQDGQNVNVNSFVTSLPSSQNLGDLKNITVQTGALIVSTAARFVDSQVTPNGIQSDGSYNTALVIDFNRNIVKGAGEITIIQRTTGYKLPAVLSEAQFNKYSGIANVNTYYARGSNGYLNATNRPDTTTKYILRYDVDTAATANAPNASGTGVPKLADDFRKAESVKLSINAGAVKISGSQLIVELTGSNALQVPGATYAISYPQGFVQDSLSAPCPAVGTEAAPVDMGSALSGIAKPFIRINKRQDSITTQTGTASNPSLVAVQPFQADVRMDSRTPGAAIFYIANQAVTTTNSRNWNYNANPASNGPQDLNTPTAPARPGDVQTTTANRQEYSAPFTIGTANDYQGLQWYVRARARNSSTGSTWSAQDSEEMAFKTVITYVIPETMEARDNGIAPGNGDQIWIRGGDAVGLSSVPGFPINWDVAEFESARLEKRRAGIRLFTKINNGNLNSNAEWKFITWEINVDTYFDIILGRDRTSDTNFAPVSTANEAWQYGPRQFAYQRAGWTSYKEQFRALPGKHRWLVSSNPSGGDTKGYLNFSGTFGARPQFTGANITITP